MDVNDLRIAVTVLSLLTFLGSFTRAYFNVAIYLMVQVGLGVIMAIAAIGRRFPALIRGIDQVMANLYPDAPQTLNGRWMLLVLSNAAVALALAGDGTGLAQLRKEFGTAMDKGPDADAFRVLTRPEQATGLIDVNTIRSRVARARADLMRAAATG